MPTRLVVNCLRPWKLSRVIRTDSDQEFAGISTGLVDLGFVRTDLMALHGFVFNGVYRPRPMARANAEQKAA